MPFKPIVRSQNPNIPRTYADNPRNKNVAIAKETMAIIVAGQYSVADQVIDIKGDLDFSLHNTELHDDNNPVIIGTTDQDSINTNPIIEVRNETTSQSAKRLIAEGLDVVALDFASARCPGGGYLGGANAQEEDLCRASGLYPCLKYKPAFYNANVLCDHTLYTDGIIYVPGVIFFRDDYMLLDPSPYKISIIASPAPNVSYATTEIDPEELKAVIQKRAIKILQVASFHGHRNIILGAWGCGAFGNDPRMVAEAFSEALKQVQEFDRVVFAVWDTRTPPAIYEAFAQVFGATNG